MVKQEVLAALDAARGRYISGQELAAQLEREPHRRMEGRGCPAPADGIPIKAVTNRGYIAGARVSMF